MTGRPRPPASVSGRKDGGFEMRDVLRFTFASPRSKNLLSPAVYHVVALGLSLWIIPKLGIETAMGVAAPLMVLGWSMVLNVRTPVSRGAKASYCAVSFATSTTVVIWRAVSASDATFKYSVAWAGGLFAFGLIMAFLGREQELVSRPHKQAAQGSKSAATEK